ncbi:hypothetical protein DV736_g5900, partial [Chaetothyriales sp. CBS 134916]
MASRGPPRPTPGGRFAQFKLVLLGESAVGKSSLVLRFVKDQFDDYRESTIGAAFLTQTIALDDTTTVKFEIWDTAGQERYKSLAPMYYRNANCAVVVYDITQAASLDKAKSWVKELQRQANENIIIALAGNKVDIVTDNPDKRAIQTADAEAYAKEAGLLFFETSAKTATNVKELFTAIAKKLPLDQAGPRNLRANTRPGVDLRPEATGQQEKSAARKYRWKLLLLLLPGFFLSSLDVTIVATALPFIASHFDKLNQLNWIVTAFTLTSTTFIPVLGQLSDSFGRHSALQLSMWSLTIGSVLCATAPVWPVLLLGRALQGVGSAGIQNVAMLVLADSVSLKEQAKNTSIFQMLNGIGYSVGPVIGGYIVDSSWRYAFVLCAGLGAVSSVSIFFLRNDLRPGSVSLSHPKQGETYLQALGYGLATLDFGGIFLFLFGVGLVILGTAWGGSTFPWTSAAVIVSLTLGAILLIAFGVYEWLLEPDRVLARAFPRTTPLIPFHVLKHKDVGLISMIAAATGASLYSVFYFIGIFFTVSEAYPASKAGVQLLFYVPGLGVGAYTAMFLCNVAPRQTFWAISTGTVIETAGIAALTYAVHTRDSALVNGMMALGGAGTGLRLMPCGLHLSGMFRERLAPAYSLLRFSMPFGGTLALTIMGSVFQNKMSAYFGSSAVTGAAPNGTTLNYHNQAALDAISQLPPTERDRIRRQAATGTMWAFISILPFLSLALVASMFLGNVWIFKKQKAPAPSTDEGTEAKTDMEEQVSPTLAAGAEVLESVYLVSLFTATVGTKKRPVVGAHERAAPRTMDVEEASGGQLVEQKDERNSCGL